MNTILTKEFLENEYLTKKVNVRDIAKQTGFSYSYLQSKIKQFGIERRRQYKSLTDKDFGLLKVVKFVGLNDRKQALWECLCKCGQSKIIQGWRLINKEVTDCGCVHRKRYGDISGAHFSNIKAHAKWRKLKFDLKIKDVWELYLKQDKKCALSGEEISFNKIRGKTTASLDRIDSSKGYTIDNVQWVHKEINQMKSDRSIEDFQNWCKKVVNCFI